jgi:hypothetical protein
LYDALLISKTNSIIKITNSLIQDNYSLDRGSIAFADT